MKNPWIKKNPLMSMWLSQAIGFRVARAGESLPRRNVRV